MKLKECREKSRSILEVFIDAIGLDGEWYSQINHTPIALGTPKANGCGEYLSPGSEEIELFIDNHNYNEKICNKLRNEGLILINRKYKELSSDLLTEDLYVTIIHETLHANRDLLIYDNFRGEKNESAYIYDNGRFELTTNEMSSNYADASQEILKGSIDTSGLTVNKYDSKTDEEVEAYKWKDGSDYVLEQMVKQEIVDEALVDLMSELAYDLYDSKQKGKEIDIWAAIEKEKKDFKGKSVEQMCEIIQKHHDFELFYWMIDPITYSQGDIHYDFFGQYTKDDQELVDKLYELGKKEKEEEAEALIKMIHNGSEGR